MEEVKVYCENCRGGEVKDCPECGGEGFLYHTYYDGIDIDKLTDKNKNLNNMITYLESIIQFYRNNISTAQRVDIDKKIMPKEEIK